MAVRYILWCEQDADCFRVGGRPLVFATSQAATDHLSSSQAFREDVVQKRWTTSRTWDVVTVTVS